MKTILVLLAVFAGIAAAQPSSQRIIYVTTAPSGACSPNGQAFRYVVSGGDVGKMYACDTTWTLLASAAGGGGVPGGSTTQIQYNNAGAFGGAAGSVWDNSARNLNWFSTANASMFMISMDPAGDSYCGAFFYLNCDTSAPTAVSSAAGTGGGDIVLAGITGGSTTITTTGTGGSGGALSFTAGAGGTANNANTQSTGGGGGGASISANNGGIATGTGTNLGGGWREYHLPHRHWRWSQRRHIKYWRKWWIRN